jgi:chemotaxis protein methyltransferase CheR
MSDRLSDVAALVQQESGIRLRSSQHDALRGALARMDVTPAELLRAASDGERRGAAVERLLDEVSVQETYFFRALPELEAIDWPTLQRRAAERGRRQVSVWNPACSSGAEAFTLLMLAAEALGGAPPPVRVLATDIAAGALARVAAAHYRRRTVRRVPRAVRERWLVPGDGGFEVVPELRAAVEPRRHNLVREPPPGEGAFDLIVCRNVLIYFEPEQVRATLRSLRTALAPSGELVLGAADRLVEGIARPPRRGRRQRARRAPRAAAARSSTRTPVELPTPPAPLNSDTLYAEGVAHLAASAPAEAVQALRQAVYLAPGHAAAAFQLGRAHEAAGAGRAASRAYAQALEATDDGDLAAACRTRMAALREVA